MIKSLLAAQRSEKVKFRIPRSVQQSIPIRCVYADGIWLVGNKHSKTWRFADVNYVAASDEDRRSIFTSYCSVLNSLPTDAAAKITIMNHRLNPVDFQRNILMREQGDSQDCYRKAFNAMLKEKSAASNDLVQEKYITLSIPQRKSRTAGPISGGWTGICAKALGGWIPGSEPFPAMTASVSFTTSSGPVRSSILPLTRPPPSVGAWTSVT